MPITTIPNTSFYMLNLRTNRMLSFGGVETAALEIFNLQATKKPPRIIVIKDKPTGPMFIDLTPNMTAKMIEEVLKTS